MATLPKVVVSWSSGKDSAFALYELLRAKQFDIVGLLTTITAEYERVSMHGVRENLLDLQAKYLGLPIFKIYIPSPCSHDTYEDELSKMIETLRAHEVTHLAFGDLFLTELRTYRESRFQETGIQPLFPLWLRNTHELATEIISAGFEAKVSCVDTRKLPAHFAGRSFDAGFLADLPRHVDPCGENGEFHTVLVASPMFSKSIVVSSGEKVERDGFAFADFIPEVDADSTAPGKKGSA